MGKKLLALMGVLVAVGVMYAGQLYLGPTTALDIEFHEYWVDTLTIKPLGGTYKYSFGGKPLYNMQLIPLNAAGDSAGAKVWTNHFGHSFFRADSFGWKTHCFYPGITAAGAQNRDTFNFHVPVEWIKILGVKGGGADSVFLFQLKGYR